MFTTIPFIPIPVTTIVSAVSTVSGIVKYAKSKE